jgi:starch phosphorylase
VSGCRLEENALTIVWARRFAEYKRAGLLASDLDRLQRLVSNPYRPVQVVIAGKAHPRDEGGKRVMQWILRQCSGDADIAPHFAFVPNYSIDVARHLTRGADIWLNTPRKPLEASGTSGMKSSDNGGLQLTVRDGWAAEVDWWDVGWGIEGRDDTADAAQLYWFLEDSIVPTFFRRNESDVPEKWVTMMKNTMGITLTRYSTRRMLLEYVDKLYLPLIERQGALLSTP